MDKERMEMPNKGEADGRGVTRRQALVLLGSALLAACTSGEPTGTDEGEGTEVRMTDQLTFSPNVLTVPAGATVTWRNDSPFAHTATGDPSRAGDPSHVVLPEGASPWDSGTVAPGGSFSRSFDVPGEYRYFCIPHEGQGMVGRLVVTS